MSVKPGNFLSHSAPEFSSFLTFLLKKKILIGCLKIRSSCLTFASIKKKNFSSLEKRFRSFSIASCNQNYGHLSGNIIVKLTSILLPSKK